MAEKSNEEIWAQWEWVLNGIRLQRKKEGLVECPRCEGCGVVPEENDPDDTCYVCDGAGTVYADEIESVAM